MTEQLQTIIASYFKYWGPEVAKMLQRISDLDKQRRIVNTFMRIVQFDLWIERADKVEITDDVEEDIEKPVTLFINLYHLDKVASDTVVKVMDLFTK